MLIQPEYLKVALEKSNEMSEKFKLFCLDATNPVKSIDELQRICKSEIGKNIEVLEHQIHYEAQPIKSYVLSFNDDSYQIVYLAGQNLCWRRMVLCKELFHVLLDDEDSRNKSVKSLIDEATFQCIQIPSPQKITPSKALQMEWLAEAAAMEFLFPYKERESVLTRLSPGEEIDYGKIAERYKVPRFYVEQYLSERRMEFLKSFHET